MLLKPQLPPDLHQKGKQAWGGQAYQGPLSLKVSEGQCRSIVEVKVRGAGEGPQVILGAVGSCAGGVRVCMEFSGTAEDWGIPKSPLEALSNKVATRVLLSQGQVKGEGFLPRLEPQRDWASRTASLALPGAGGLLGGGPR